MKLTEQNIENNSPKNKTDDEGFLLSNVRLETGFMRNKYNEVVATETSLFDLFIFNGKIESITKKKLTNESQTNLDVKTVDANEFLMLPTFQDMHIHIDKTYYGSGWQAAPWTGSIKDMIRLEEKLIPKLLPDSQRKAEECIQLMQSYGSTFARCHCNIDPISGLKSLEHLLLALDNYQDSFDWEIAAFPQHGILYSQSEGLLREAAQMDIDFIGGLDPTVVDGDMKRSLDIMFDIALDYDKGVDIHLHEDLPSGKAVMEYMIKRVKENEVLQGKTFITHAYALAMMPQKELEFIAEQFAEYGIGIVSSVPIGKQAMPIPTLRKHNVNVLTGTDNLMDNFSPFGTGDMLQKANLCAQLYNWTDEYRLNRALKMITNHTLPLDDQGEQVWPFVGADADFILVNASCSAEAVARLPRREAVYYKGKVIL
ncbi:amidohydrolase [Psychrobacter sp. FBL11]|uniref:Amidohydrolase n=1 Tax=Psychrobacter saeujeotis TaxID=3143436 RepID=A0ABU9X6K0_9GAMM|nr:amidohydrolase [uncultured Psychrobacter sp.]